MVLFTIPDLVYTRVSSNHELERCYPLVHGQHSFFCELELEWITIIPDELELKCELEFIIGTNPGLHLKKISAPYPGPFLIFYVKVLKMDVRS